MYKNRKKLLYVLGVLIFLFQKGIAHPMPNSVVNFSFGKNEIQLKIEVPVSEFEPAFNKKLEGNEEQVIAKNKNEIIAYFLQHVKIKSKSGVTQPIKCDYIIFNKTAYDFGEYQELIVNMSCQTTDKFNNRDFIFDYDAVIHQVVTHFALIKIHQDFENGITPEDSVIISTVHLDIASNTIKPLNIQLEKGSTWKGFSKMVKLGMLHIYTGLDHLLFILILIIISPLVLKNNVWDKFGGWKYTIKRLFKVITAFTIGHCITLFIFSIFNLNGISRYIEIAIAFTIIATAIHAIKPFFYNKEIIITFFFGLIHGTAFGITLNEWGISNSQKLISLLGFNIGIEFMQLLLIVCCLPLIYLSKFSAYKFLRIAIASITILISSAWVVARTTGKSNLVTDYIARIF